MDRLLRCTCGRDLVVSNSQAGQELTCACGKIVAVPTLRGLAALPLAQALAQTTADAPQPYATSGVGQQLDSGANRAWQGWRGPALALATAGFLIAAVAGSWFGFQRFQIDTSYTVEAEIAAGAEMIESYDPNTLSTIWHQFGSMGLGEKHPPAFFLWQVYAEDRAKKATTSGVVAAVFGVLALAIALSAKRR